MTEKGKSTFVHFLVIDPGTGMPTSGLAESITLYLSQDFGECTEIDNVVSASQDVSGLYTVLLSDAQMDADYVTLCPSCEGYCIHPVTLTNTLVQRNRTTKVPIYVYHTSTGQGIPQLNVTVYLSFGDDVVTGNNSPAIEVATNTVIEVDSTHAPGLYVLQVTNTEMGFDRISVYPRPERGYAHPIIINTTDFGAIPVNDVDVTDQAYDWLRYNISQFKALTNIVISYLANWDQPVINNGYTIKVRDVDGNIIAVPRTIQQGVNDIPPHPSPEIASLEGITHSSE